MAAHLSLKRSLSLLLLLCSCSITAASKEAPSITVRVESPTEYAQVVPAVEVEPDHEEKLTKRRPMVDAGLRYSSNDWAVNLLLTPTSFILRRIRFHLLSNVAGCLFVLHYHETHPWMKIPMTGHSLLASSLGLLLSYRTNSAYGRFWEARGHWTNTKATCRNLAIMMKSHVQYHSPKASAKFLELLAAYPATLMHLCLGGAARLPEYAQKHMPPESKSGMNDRESSWPAMYMCLQLQNALREAGQESKSSRWNLVEADHLVAAAHYVDKLMDNMSSCEKIVRTPVPWSYSRHTSRFLSLWIGTLSLALVGNMNRWVVLAVVTAASYCMLGIEEISHLIEQPFLGDPLDGQDRIYALLDEDGEASDLIKRGQTTQPYDIGIPVCSLAIQIRREVEAIANGFSSG